MVMVLLLMLLLSSFLHGFSLESFAFVASSRLKRIKRRNFSNVRRLQRRGNERSKYIFAVSCSTWLASIVRETFDEQ